MPTFSSTHTDSELVRTSASEQLAAFRGSPPPASDKLLGDNEMEGQMRGLPGVYLQLGHTRAETAQIGSCVAVGYVNSEGHRFMRIYRKTAKGWSPHTFKLRVERNKTKRQPKGRSHGHATETTRPPVYSWQPYVGGSTSKAHGKQRQVRFN